MRNERRALAAAIFWWTSTVWAAQPPTSAIKSCAKAIDDKERLACFDREVAILAAADMPPKDASAQPPKMTPEQKLGLPRAKVDKLETPPDAAAPPPVIKGLTAHISGITLNAAGRQVFTLDNGQVWAQIESDTSFIVHPGDLVNITKGSFGSFFLSSGKHRNTRVSRAR